MTLSVDLSRLRFAIRRRARGKLLRRLLWRDCERAWRCSLLKDHPGICLDDWGNEHLPEQL